jgi:hypothetical protein
MTKYFITLSLLIGCALTNCSQSGKKYSKRPRTIVLSNVSNKQPWNPVKIKQPKSKPNRRKNNNYIDLTDAENSLVERYTFADEFELETEKEPLKKEPRKQEPRKEEARQDYHLLDVLAGLSLEETEFALSCHLTEKQINRIKRRRETNKYKNPREYNLYLKRELERKITAKLLLQRDDNPANAIYAQDPQNTNPTRKIYGTPLKKK